MRMTLKYRVVRCRSVDRSIIAWVPGFVNPPNVVSIWGSWWVLVLSRVHVLVTVAVEGVGT